jgi:hypothetical protein
MKMKIVVMDAQGGGIGRQLIMALREKEVKAQIIAVGTNSAALNAMLKAGADAGAVGENAAVVCCQDADIVTGPMGIVLADAMLGEITPRMAQAAASSSAVKVLIPFRSCGVTVVGVEDKPMKDLIAEAVAEICRVLKAQK